VLQPVPVQMRAGAARVGAGPCTCARACIAAHARVSAVAVPEAMNVTNRGYPDVAAYGGEVHWVGLPCRGALGYGSCSEWSAYRRSRLSPTSLLAG
jgi:hypothetical protein